MPRKYNSPIIERPFQYDESKYEEIVQKLHERMKQIGSLGGKSRSPKKIEAARKNGRRCFPKYIKLQAQVFAEFVRNGRRPRINKRLAAYIMKRETDPQIIEAAKELIGPRTVWTLTEEVRRRIERMKKDAQSDA